jgi:hypothetical protein
MHDTIFMVLRQSTSRKGGLVQHFVASHAKEKMRSRIENLLQSAAQQLPVHVLCPEPLHSKGEGALLKMEGISGVRDDCGGRANCLAGLF